MEEKWAQTANSLERAIEQFEREYPGLSNAMALLGITIENYERSLQSMFVNNTVSSNGTELVTEHGNMG